MVGATRWTEVDMCGRSQLLVTVEELFDLYRLEHPAPGLPLPLDGLPRWSVAPTQMVPSLIAMDGKRVLRGMRWGFPMTWLARQGKDPWSRPLINAKSEEAATKRTWAAALRERRCVVPATAFYEWLRLERRRFPVELSPVDGPLLHFAGIWQRFERNGDPVDCVSLLTTAANDDVVPVHHRMPVLLVDGPAIDRWLAPVLDADTQAALLQPAPAGTLRLKPMHTRLNHWSASGADLRAADWSPGRDGLPTLGPAGN